MSIERIEITSLKTKKTYIVENIKAYRVETSIDVPADSFDFVIGNHDYQASEIFSAGDSLKFYINNKLVLEGIIDDIDLEYDIKSNDITIVGRDKMSVLLDNDANPATFYKLGLSDYLGKIAPKYKVAYNSSNNTKFDKIVVSPGENEYSVIERLARERNLVPMFDSLQNKLLLTKLISSTANTYLFSNTDSNGIRIKNCKITISNDIRNEVIVYGDNYEKNKNIKGVYRDSSLKTTKRRIINESDIENSSDANKRAKEEFYNLNKDALNVNIITRTKEPIYINKCAKVNIVKMGFSAYLLVDKVSYTKSIDSSATTSISLKLMPGIKVSYKNNEIPLLPKL